MAKKRVLVGMSGGVDSSAAAALLCDKGYEVCGCTLKMYDNSVLGEGYGEGGCCSLADVDDARSVCRKLGIDHITLNFTDEFGKHVMKPFADSYIKGETPNPCIECLNLTLCSGGQCSLNLIISPRDIMLTLPLKTADIF